MTKKEAERSGLSFTGMYASKWEEGEIEDYKKKAALLRKVGIRCVQVSEKEGVSWYAEPDYYKYTHLKYNKWFVENADNDKKKLMEEYERKLKEIDERVKEAQDNIDYMKKKYGEKVLLNIL